MKSEQEEMDRLDKRKDAATWSNFPSSQKLIGGRKARFVEVFVATDETSSYPFEKLDLLKETCAEWKGVRLEDQLADQIALAMKEHPAVGAPPPMTIAVDLLTSFDQRYARALQEFALRDISVERTLAHLLSLGFALDPPLLASIARRATLGLLNWASGREAARGRIS